MGAAWARPQLTELYSGTELYHRLARLHALEALCATLSDRHRYAEAVQAGLAAVAGEPLRESAHRTLIRAHVAAGNRGEALRQYATYRQLAMETFGIGPSPEMEAMVREPVVAHGSVDRPPAAGPAVFDTHA